MKNDLYDDLSICIPIYNEEDAIEKVLENLLKVFNGSEIIAVDDGSEDKTSEILNKFNNIKIFHHHRNKGYGAAIKTAIRNSTRKFVAWYDSDGQHNVEDLKKLMLTIKNEDVDCVIGVRGKESYKEKNRIFGKKILNVIAEIITRTKIPDLNSGLRIFRKSVIRKYLHILPDSFSASTTSTIVMIERGYRLKYEKIITKKRVGKSSVKIFKDGFKTIKLLINLLILFKAFNFFTFLAFFQIVPALIYGIYISIVNRLGFPIFASIFIISGVFTFFLGILAEQITALRKEKFEE